MIRAMLILTALLVRLSPANEAAAATATLTADASTVSTSANSNLGSKTTLVVKGPPAVTSTGNAYLQFDLSTLAPGTTGGDVAKATLTLGVNSVPKVGSFDVFRVTSPLRKPSRNAEWRSMLRAMAIRGRPHLLPSGRFAVSTGATQAKATPQEPRQSLLARSVVSQLQTVRA